MSMRTAMAELVSSTITLQRAIAELVVTVHEDRPLLSDVAAVDVLGEAVCELQAAAVDAGTRLTAITDVRQLPEVLPAVEAALARGALQYWRELRAHEARARLRMTAR